MQHNALTAPKPLAQAEEDLRERLALPLLPSEPIKPDWLASVCTYRDLFAKTVFVVDTRPDEAFAFLYASQNPRFALFLALKSRTVVLPAFEDM